MISPFFDFHTEACNMVNTTITGAKEYGLDISTLPPHLSVMTVSEEISYDLGEEQVLMGLSKPQILQDVEPELWSFIAHQKMYDELNSIGFVFWCLIEDGITGEMSVFCMSWVKSQGFKGFLSDIDLKSEPKELTDPHQIVPLFLDYDFEVDCVVH